MTTAPTPAHMDRAWKIVDACRDVTWPLQNLITDDFWQRPANQIAVEIVKGAK